MDSASSIKPLSTDLRLLPSIARQPWRAAVYAVTTITNRKGGRYWTALWIFAAVLIVMFGFLSVWLLQSHQVSEEQQRVEEAAVQISGAIHKALSKSLQDVSAVAWTGKDPVVWRETAGELLRESKSTLRLERRNEIGDLVEAKDSQYFPPLFVMVKRFEAEAEARNACKSAAGPGVPVYSKTYFVPVGSGRGEEVLDVCAAQQLDGKTFGFTVATIGLTQLLESAMEHESTRIFEASLVEGTNTRLARAGATHGRPTLRSERVIAVPGLSMRLRVESARGAPALLQLNFVSGLFIAFGLTFLTTVALLIREARRMQQTDQATRLHQEELARVARLASVGELASLIGHELNQPLTSILAYAKTAQNLGGDTLSADVKQLLDNVADEARRSATVVKSVRDFVSRNSAKREIVDVHDLIDGIRPILEGMAKDYGARLIESDAGEPLIVECTRVMIEQVIVNLVRNGLQAMQNNRPEKLRTIRISAVKADERFIRVTVTDTGPGVSEQLAKRLAEPDFKSFHKILSEGLGLGLSLSRSVIHAHRGSISCRNREDTPHPGAARRIRGATFCFTLPRQFLANSLEDVSSS